MLTEEWALWVGNGADLEIREGYRDALIVDFDSLSSSCPAQDSSPGFVGCGDHQLSLPTALYVDEGRAPSLGIMRLDHSPLLSHFRARLKIIKSGIFPQWMRLEPLVCVSVPWTRETRCEPSTLFHRRPVVDR